MAVFLGLDCGGSSCRAVAVNSYGTILHQGQAGAANLASTPLFRLQNHISRAIGDSVHPDFVCGCFAGLLTPDDRERAIGILRSAFPSAELRAEADYYAALRASDNADVCVIAGTGSIVCSQVGNVLRKSGGRGYLLGDIGSAYQYGRASMLHFLEVGSTNISESLREAIFKRFGSLEENEVLARLYRGGMPAAQLAKLASAFSKDVRAALPYAVNELSKQSDGLAEVVSRHIESFHAEKPELTLCLAGGLWDGHAVFRNAFEEKLRHRVAGKAVLISRIAKPPVYGAVELAKDLET